MQNYKISVIFIFFLVEIAQICIKTLYLFTIDFGQNEQKIVVIGTKILLN